MTIQHDIIIICLIKKKTLLLLFWILLVTANKISMLSEVMYQKKPNLINELWKELLIIFTKIHCYNKFWICQFILNYLNMLYQKNIIILLISKIACFTTFPIAGHSTQHSQCKGKEVQFGSFSKGIQSIISCLWKQHCGRRT